MRCVFIYKAAATSAPVALWLLSLQRAAYELAINRVIMLSHSSGHKSRVCVPSVL